MPAKKQSKLKSKNKSGVFRESELGMILEENRHNLQLILEGQQAMKNELRREFKQDLKKEIGGLRKEFKSDISDLRKEFKFDLGGLRKELKTEIEKLRQELHENVKLIVDRLLKIEKEIKEIKIKLDQKADKKDFLLLKDRVSFLESELEKYKKMCHQLAREKQAAGI